jgi:hypothetical protein
MWMIIKDLKDGFSSNGHDFSRHDPLSCKTLKVHYIQTIWEVMNLAKCMVVMHFNPDGFP